MDRPATATLFLVAFTVLAGMVTAPPTPPPTGQQSPHHPGGEASTQQQQQPPAAEAPTMTLEQLNALARQVIDEIRTHMGNVESGAHQVQGTLPNVAMHLQQVKGNINQQVGQLLQRRDPLSLMLQMPTLQGEARNSNILLSHLLSMLQNASHLHTEMGVIEGQLRQVEAELDREEEEARRAAEHGGNGESGTAQ